MSSATDDFVSTLGRLKQLDLRVTVMTRSGKEIEARIRSVNQGTVSLEHDTYRWLVALDAIEFIEHLNA